MNNQVFSYIGGQKKEKEMGDVSIPFVNNGLSRFKLFCPSTSLMFDGNDLDRDYVGSFLECCASHTTLLVDLYGSYPGFYKRNRFVDGLINTFFAFPRIALGNHPQSFCMHDIVLSPSIHQQSPSKLCYENNTQNNTKSVMFGVVV